MKDHCAIHLVSWEDLCKPKELIGVGLRHMKECNKAYTIKLAWGLIEQSDALWVKALKIKYKCGPLKLLSISK